MDSRSILGIARSRNHVDFDTALKGFKGESWESRGEEVVDECGRRWLEESSKRQLCLQLSRNLLRTSATYIQLLAMPSGRQHQEGP
jgi:hypothetical protein